MTRAFAVPVVPESGGPQAEQAAREVHTTLSGLYDRAFADPAAWQGRVPERVWDAFAPNARPQARRDAASFTLAAVGGPLSAVEVTGSSLTVRVLLGPDGGARAAMADLLFDARATLGTGEVVTVANRASVILRPISGRWMIVSYPSAANEVSPS